MDLGAKTNFITKPFTDVIKKQNILGKDVCLESKYHCFWQRNITFLFKKI